MVGPGQFANALAVVLGVPSTTIEQYDRILLEAGLRTKGGRGPSAARLTARDAANLMTAILGSAKVLDAAAAVKLYATTRPDRGQSSKKLFKSAGIVELEKLPSEHSFIDALETLIVSGMEGGLGSWMEEHSGGKRARKPSLPLIDIAASMPGAIGDIRLAGVLEGVTAQVRYMTPGPWKETHQDSDGEGADLAQSRSITARTVVRIADLLAGRGD